MADVAHDRDAQVLQVALALADGQHVQQSLRGVRDVRLARVQYADVGLHVACNQGRQAGLGVAHHEHVHHHRLQRVNGVEHGLALHARG